MANCGPDTNKSQFYISFVALPFLNGKSEVIGEMISGFDTLKLIEKCGSEDGTPQRYIKVCDCGEFKPEFEAEKKRLEEEAQAKIPKLFDDEFSGYPPAFEWFVVDLRKQRKERYEAQRLEKAKERKDVLSAGVNTTRRKQKLTDLMSILRDLSRDGLRKIWMRNMMRRQ